MYRHVIKRLLDILLALTALIVLALPMLVLALGKPDEEVVLTDLPEGGDSSYYRKDGVHYVPKRALEEVVIE